MFKLPVRIAVTTTQHVLALLDNLLTQLDTYLCACGDDDDEEEDPRAGIEPCICGSTDHQARRIAELTMPGTLHNGEFGTLPVELEFSFDEGDPYALIMEITLQVATEDGKVLGHDSAAWVFARDLLDTALSREDGTSVGDGDMSISYMSAFEEVWFWLTHVDGRKIRLDAIARPLQHFMAASFQMVPHDTEAVDVDTAIDKLLGGDQ